MPFFKKTLIPYYLLFGLLCFLCRNNIFFWDTYQLCGKQAWALYENGLTQWILPSKIDSGHPPLFGFYHALLWKIFGPNLWVSHFAMLPFLCGIVYFFYRIGAHFLDEHKAAFLLPLLLVDPVFMGQAVLASPDIVLLCFMLMCLYGILTQSKAFIIVGAIFLGLISMRGMMVLAALILFDLYLQLPSKSLRQISISTARYLPAILLVVSFLLFHYIKTGWLGHHEDSSWAESFAYVDFGGGVRNTAVYIWRLLDFGRVFLWAGIILILILGPLSWKDPKVKKLLCIIGLLTLIITPVLLIHKGLVLHRYLLPILLLLSVLFWYMLFSSDLSKNVRQWIWSLVLIGMFTGNFWVYQKHISQGWDSTLGHLPYYSLRNQMINYLNTENINLQTVGTAFPNIGNLKNFDPSSSDDGFKKYDLKEDQYIFYSNIYNDFTDQELEALSSSTWKEEKHLQYFPVCVILYKRNK